MKTRVLFVIALLCTMVQGVWADVVWTNVSSESDLRTAIQNGGVNVRLTADVLLNDKLIIDGKSVTIDLNGHKLYRNPNVFASHPDDNVINVSNGSNLTITSSISGGIIEGGLNEEGGGGIRIPSGNTVSVSNITFQMNFSYGDGGAIWNCGTLTVSDCTFLSNLADNGSAIWNNGVLNMHGAIVMTDNTAEDTVTPSNLYMKSGTVINVTGSLTGSQIGVSCEDGFVTFTNGYATYNEDTDPATLFIPDISATEVVAADGNGEACITLPANSITYVERGWDGKKVTSKTNIVLPGDYELLGSSSGDRALLNKIYVVNDDITIDGDIYVYAENCKLILCDGASLTTKSIVLYSQYLLSPLANGARLSIYGQSGDTGCLTTVGSDFPAIASLGLNDMNNDVLNIHGGIITATSPDYCAGIGTHNCGELNLDNHYFGAINIYGGIVIARGGSGGAGIGSGPDFSTNKNYGIINIYGGDVTAVGGEGGAGIGGGRNSRNENDVDAVNIYGGNVTAMGGTDAAGIGSGNGGVDHDYQIPNPGTITISGGVVRAYGTGKGAGIGGGVKSSGYKTYISGGVIIAHAGIQEGPEEGYSAIGSGQGGSSPGLIVFADNMGVRYGIGTDQYFAPSTQRSQYCWNYPAVKIEACWHPGADITITDGSSHEVDCQLCKITSEQHSFNYLGECPTCHLINFADNAENGDVIDYWNDETGKSVVLTGRTLYKDGNWNTLCLPFDVVLDGSLLDGATVKELDTEGEYSGHKTGFDPVSGTLYFYFKDVSVIEAGKPYIVKWDSGSNIESPLFSGVTISNVKTDVKSDDEMVYFIGTYAPEMLEGGNVSNLYLGTGNQLYWPSKDRTVNAFRGYFHVDSGSASNVRAFVLNIENEIPTDVLEIKENSSDDIWYSLSGIRLSGKPTERGLYIHNGKKVVVDHL